MTTAKTLCDAQRVAMEQALNCKVADHYRSAEVFAWVAQSPHGAYHISHEFGVLESLQDDKPVRDVPGEAVGTGFVNRAQVLNRYRIGDSLVLPTPKVA